MFQFHTLQYFLNIILNQDNNINIFIRDENNIFKTVSTNAVKFTGKRVMERMKGTTFMVTLTNTNNSRHNIILENIINNETIYE